MKKIIMFALLLSILATTLSGCFYGRGTITYSNGTKQEIEINSWSELKDLLD